MVKKSARRTRRTHTPTFKARVALWDMLPARTGLMKFMLLVVRVGRNVVMCNLKRHLQSIGAVTDRALAISRAAP